MVRKPIHYKNCKGSHQYKREVRIPANRSDFPGRMKPGLMLSMFRFQKKVSLSNAGIRFQMLAEGECFAYWVFLFRELWCLSKKLIPIWAYCVRGIVQCALKYMNPRPSSRLIRLGQLQPRVSNRGWLWGLHEPYLCAVPPGLFFIQFSATASFFSGLRFFVWSWFSLSVFFMSESSFLRVKSERERERKRERERDR